MEYSLNATKRNIDGKKVKKLRKSGLLPAVLYGNNKDSLNIQLNQKEFEQVYKEAGESSLINLTLETGEKDKVLVGQTHYDPYSSKLLHTGLRRVDLKEKIKANVPIEFTGESPAVKSGLGLLLTLIDEIEVECYPADLPQEIVVDISKLSEVGDTISVGELSLDRSKIEISEDGEEPVVKIDHAEMEEEPEEEVSEEEAVAGVEVSEEKEDSEQEGEENE